MSHLNAVSKAILKSYKDLGSLNLIDGEHLPSRHTIHELIDGLKELLFPGYFESEPVCSKELEIVTEAKVLACYGTLKHELVKVFKWAKEEDVEVKAESVCGLFLSEIPEIRARLKEDAIAIFKGDPAAKSEQEILLSYPGFQAITVYRMAHFLAIQNVPLIPRLMTEIAHSETGIDIHPSAQIGRHFCIDHGTGIVIGETAVIGEHVKLYQGVTLGALSVSKEKSQGKRHPTLDDHVTVYSKATILGGKTVIGRGSIIGGNVWLTHSVPENSKLYLTLDRGQVMESNA
ncbi:MAG: serine O-acetyltransferase EpsC [Candidatus Margulisiibacteriota bacterium]